MLVDYHLHTNNSFDGKQTIDELCQAAIARGIDEIAITDHMDIFAGKSYGFILNCEKTFSDIDLAKDKYRGKLVIRKGIELGQPMRNPAAYEEFIEEWPLDFIIGSVHNMENDIDVGEYNYKEIDFSEFFPRYLDCILDFARNYEFDVLGHVTYPIRYMILQTGKKVDPMEYQDQFIEIFKAAIARGKGIELNTSSIARGVGELMPTIPLLRLYRDMGGEIITVGSDAHVKSQTGITSKTANEILKQVGFRYLTTFENREPIMNLID